MPASVEADGHVRVAASVPVDGARLSGADKGARAPANWSPLAPPVSVWVSLDPAWRAPLPAGGRPAQGAPANWSPCRPPARRPPPRQLGQPTGRRALACAPPPPPPPRPPRPPRPPFVALARATLCSPRGRAPTGPPAPLNRLPSTGTLARAAGGPSPTGEAHLRRQTARRPCGHVPQPTGHCPSSPGGGGARVPAAISAGQLARVHGGGDPEGTGRHRCPPASPEKGVWAPLQAPGAAGPVDGRCLPTNLAKDRADAQRLVATRLLDRLHDPLGHFSRLQRIHPRAR
ncbi:hypothetical protein KXV36_007177 [Aspergillus fumigatus]|nr:hypothetical protein KXV36_007177 [Aspergillus fumigatus]